MSTSAPVLSLEYLLTRLTARGCDPEPVRNHWVADCPICDDDGQGLVIFPESDSHGLSIACDAGCNPAQVKDELSPAESMTLDELAGPPYDERPPAEETEGRSRRAEHLSDAPSVYPDQAPRSSAHGTVAWPPALCPSCDVSPAFCPHEFPDEPPDDWTPAVKTPRHYTAGELGSLFAAAGLSPPETFDSCERCGVVGGEAVVEVAEEMVEGGALKFCPHDFLYLEPDELDDDTETASPSTSRPSSPKFVAIRSAPMLELWESAQLRPDAVVVLFWLMLRMDYRTAAYECTVGEIGAACFSWVKDPWRKTEKALCELVRAGAITRQRATRNGRTTIKVEWREQVKATRK